MFGPHLGRPTVDTLKRSRHLKMKSTQFSWDDEAWRVAFACDALRRAIPLVGADDEHLKLVSGEKRRRPTERESLARPRTQNFRDSPPNPP